MPPKTRINAPEDVLESICDVFISVDLDFTITYINKLAEEFLGIKQRDIIGKNFLEVFPQTKNTIFYGVYQQLVNKKDFIEREKIEFEAFFNEPFKNW